MRIGIIVHSQTGNTLSVAEKLRDRLTAGGHAVVVERLTTVGGDARTPQEVRLETVPDIAPYDGLVFASPVRGFAPSPALVAYLSQVPPLAGKKVACFVTEAFPFPWMGGNTAIAKMKALCSEKNGSVAGTGIVNWSNARREQQIEGLVDRIGSLF